MFIYRNLDVWKLAKNIIIDIYKITDNFPSKEKFGLCSQMNRASISAASNIAEGCCRVSAKDQAHFTEIAFGSLMELSCQLEIANDLEFLDKVLLNVMLVKVDQLSIKLSALRNSQLKRIKTV